MKLKLNMKYEKIQIMNIKITEKKISLQYKIYL